MIGPFWAKWELGRVPQRASFLCGKNHARDLSATSQRPIFTKFGHETYFGVPSRNPEIIFENFHFRDHLPPKSEIESRSKSNRHLTHSRLQVTVCTAERYCLLHVVVQGPGRFRDRSTFLYDVKVAQFSDFGLFTYLPVTSLYSPGVTSQNDYDFSTW